MNTHIQTQAPYYLPSRQGRPGAPSLPQRALYHDLLILDRSTWRHVWRAYWARQGVGFARNRGLQQCRPAHRTTRNAAWLRTGLCEELACTSASPRTHDQDSLASLAIVVQQQQPLTRILTGACLCAGAVSSATVDAGISDALEPEVKACDCRRDADGMAPRAKSAAFIVD